uniref:Uncharacterized protein n=1 Tax=Nymphaea colorata TaxID=210225 RepID=A0A5K0Y528_9MAGN
MCYVGKATKIFIVVVSILAFTGLVLAFHFVRHGTNNKAHQPLGCSSASGFFCPPPFYPQPIPAVTVGAGPPFSAPGPPPPSLGGGDGGGVRSSPGPMHA